MMKLLTMLHIMLNIVIVITEISDIFLEPCNEYLFFTPNYIYENTEMNIIGCYITSIFLVCLMPLYCLPVSIIYLIYWLFHIGRKD